MTVIRDVASEAWSDVMNLTRTVLITKFTDKDLCSDYTILLNDLRPDRIFGDTVHLGMMTAPASQNRHHAFRGGLSVHLLQMWQVWEHLRYTLKQMAPEHEQLNDSNVWRAILHHDLNKVWRYRLVREMPWEVDYATDHLQSLLGATNKSLWLLQSHGIQLSLPLYNALLLSEGGFSDYRTRADTVLAKVVYVLDELSANVVDRLQYHRFWDSKIGGMTDEDAKE